MSRVSQSQYDLSNTDVPKNDLTLPPPRLRPKEDFDEFAAPEALPESGREGLPPSYRMRADRHYIDRMSDSVGMPVRLVLVEQIERVEPTEDQTPPGDALTKSIAAHGVLQPLLVTKQDSRYKLIAGRRRLAAAIAAGLTSVPCLVHDLGEAEAAVLAEAENVRGDRPKSAAGSAVPANIAEILREIASDLIHLERSAALLRRPSGGFVFQKTAVDLVAAQAWRTAWVANAVTLGLGEQKPARRARQLDSIVDRVAQGFEPELRLCGGQLQTNVAASAAIDGALGELALTGAILATLSQLEEFVEPSIEVRSTTTSDKDFVVVEVLQPHVPVAPDVAQVFTDSAAPTKGHVVVALAGSVLRSVTAQYRGSTELITEGSGSVVRCSFRV
jgi:ParB/Sulfiredoxin domain